MVSPDNRSRREINERIHRELKSSGRVDEQEVRLTVPVPRQEMTGADRRWAAQYETGDIVGYTRGSQAVGVESGEYVQVTSAVRVQAREGRLVSVQWTKDRSNGAPETANNCKLPSPTRYFLQNLRQIDVNSGFSAGILSGFCSFSYTYRLRSYKKEFFFFRNPPARAIGDFPEPPRFRLGETSPPVP